MPPNQGAPPETLKELLSGVDPEQLRQVMPLVRGSVITMMFTDIVELDANHAGGRRRSLFRGTRAT